MKSKETLIKYIFVALFVILLGVSAALVILGWAGGHFDSVATFREYMVSFGLWGPIVLTLIQMLQVILPVLPGFLGCVVGAWLYGPVVGFLANYIGLSAGSIVAYCMHIDRINKSKSYTTMLFLAILLPLAPDDFFCYFTGLIDMRPRKFITIILIAKPWCILFYSIFFAYFI